MKRFLLLFVVCLILFSQPQKSKADTQDTPFDHLKHVENWKVKLHLVYEWKREDGIDRATSDWTGILNSIDPDDVNEDEVAYSADLDVAVDGSETSYTKDGDHQDVVTIVAKGKDKYNFGLQIEKDGYKFGQGYCGTPFGTRTWHCPKKGDEVDDGCVTYSEPWDLKIPLPSQGTTLSGSATITSETPGEYNELANGMTITVNWEFVPNLEVRLKYGETSMDVASMYYFPGISVDPHIYICTAGGGRGSWMPHSNFAGELWINGVNKIKIHPGKPGPLGVNNVSSDYMIRRDARSWDLDKPSQAAPWHFDSTNPIQDWLDPAGVSADAGPPPTWNRRVMDEFLVQVVDHPEFGRIYVAFVMETRKNAYRIRYSNPRDISGEEYNNIKTSLAPLFPYPFTGKDDGWIELVQDAKTKQWSTRIR